MKHAPMRPSPLRKEYRPDLDDDIEIPSGEPQPTNRLKVVENKKGIAQFLIKTSPHRLPPIPPRANVNVKPPTTAPARSHLEKPIYLKNGRTSYPMTYTSSMMTPQHARNGSSSATREQVQSFGSPVTVNNHPSQIRTRPTASTSLYSQTPSWLTPSMSNMESWSGTGFENPLRRQAAGSTSTSIMTARIIDNSAEAQQESLKRVAGEEKSRSLSFKKAKLESDDGDDDDDTTDDPDSDSDSSDEGE